MDHRSPSPSPRLSALALGALLALQACQSGHSGSTTAKERVEIANEFTASAEVVGIERAQRLVRLRRDDGALLELEVGPAARNFDQVAVGDSVRVRYRESLAASLRPAGESAQAAQGALGAGRAESGAKPGGGLGLALSARVKIESIDLARDIVVFSLATGELVAHRLATSEGRAFARGLHVGDIVQLDYAVGLALSVEKL